MPERAFECGQRSSNNILPLKQKTSSGCWVASHSKTTPTMSTSAVAGRLIELCKEGKFLEAQHELYDKDIVSIDPDGSKTVGASNMNAKEVEFLSKVDKFRSISWSDPLIAGSYFTVILELEIEFKKIGYKRIEEVCVYQVRNGKIVFEQFFRDL
jgi:hypothetical protein